MQNNNNIFKIIHSPFSLDLPKLNEIIFKK